jgi:DNA-binding HxlR family transcriptional regulator
VQVARYGQYCPIALGAEVLAERWTPIVLRNLLVGCERFGEILEGAPGLSRSVLVARLRSLERDGVVARTGSGATTRYRLTEAGHELADVVLALGRWGARWRETLPEHHDPYLMLWALSRLVDPATLSPPRVVVRFDLTGGRTPDRYWFVASRAGNEVCVSHPGGDEDGVVATDPTWLYRWHCGHVDLGAAIRAGGMRVTGPPWLHRLLARWGALSPFAGVSPVAAARRHTA